MWNDPTFAILAWIVMMFLILGPMQKEREFLKRPFFNRTWVVIVRILLGLGFVAFLIFWTLHTLSLLFLR
jgi:hypothetical protein